MMLRVKYGILGLLMMCGLSTHAQELKEYEYRPNVVYDIRTGIGIATQVEISPYEQVKSYVSGLSAGWTVERREHVFYFKPKAENVDTNVLITTDQRVYSLNLKVVATNWRSLKEVQKNDVHYRVRFVYPDSPWLNAAQQGGLSSARTRGINPAQYNADYDYSISSQAAWLVPLQVYDDGRFTYIKQDEHAEFPAFFGRKTEHGDDFLLNTSIEKNTVIVHGVYPYIVLRHGNDVVGLRRNKP